MALSQTNTSGWDYHSSRILAQLKLTPIRVTAFYLVFGFLALYVSDFVLVSYISDPLLSQVQAIKGGVEVVVTGALVFMLTKGSRAPLEHTKDRLSTEHEELHVLHRVLRHNLRNDLTVLYGYADALPSVSRAGDSTLTPEGLKTKVDEILHYTEQADQIRRISEGNGRTTTFEINEVVREIRSGNDEITDEVTVNVDVPEEMTIEANHMFPSAIDELVTNAIVHNDSESVDVEIAADPAAGPPGMSRISVSDNGPGISDRVLDVLRTGQEGQLTHLDGMGLWFVIWTINNKGGNVDFESDESGTVVQIEVPSTLTFENGTTFLPSG